jgi:hypothetical protein
MEKMLAREVEDPFMRPLKSPRLSHRPRLAEGDVECAFDCRCACSAWQNGERDVRRLANGAIGERCGLRLSAFPAEPLVEAGDCGRLAQGRLSGDVEMIADLAAGWRHGPFCCATRRGVRIHLQPLCRKRELRLFHAEDLGDRWQDVHWFASCVLLRFSPVPGRWLASVNGRLLLRLHPQAAVYEPLTGRSSGGKVRDTAADAPRAHRRELLEGD